MAKEESVIVIVEEEEIVEIDELGNQVNCNSWYRSDKLGEPQPLHYHDDNEEEEEEEEDSDCYTDSSSEEESDEEDEEGDDDLESVEVLNDYGIPITDESLMERMEADNSLSTHEKMKLLPKIRRYLNSIDESEGYECTHFPGVIWGLTQWIPRQILIDKRDRFPEGYNHFIFMASLAIQDYNEKFSAEFKVEHIETVTSTVSMRRSHNITFTACWGVRVRTFQASVWDDTLNLKMKVYSCRVKPGSPEILKETSDESVDAAGKKKTDLLTLISDLDNRSNQELMELIGNTKKDKDMLLKKIRKYFASVIKSEGFECKYFPGDIPGVTYLKPRQKILVHADWYPECYYHVCHMAKLAMDYYFKDKGTENMPVVGGVQLANLWKESNYSYVYYLSFKVKELYNDYNELEFQAKVQDKQHVLDVVFCRQSL